MRLSAAAHGLPWWRRAFCGSCCIFTSTAYIVHSFRSTSSPSLSTLGNMQPEHHHHRQASKGRPVGRERWRPPNFRRSSEAAAAAATASPYGSLLALSR